MINNYQPNIDKTIDETIDDKGIDFENYDLNYLINEVYKEAHPVGYQILVRIYKPKVVEKTSGGLYLSPIEIKKRHEDDKFSNFVGLVVKMAPGCYQDKETYKFTGAYCKVGDWIMFPRAAALTYAHKGITSATITEDKFVQVIDDPRVARRISYD